MNIMLIAVGVTALACVLLVVLTNYRDRAKDRVKKKDKSPHVQQVDSDAGTRTRATAAEIEAMTGWVHPAVKRGTTYAISKFIALVGAVAVLIFLLMQNPTGDRLLWVRVAVAATVLVGFLTKKHIEELRRDYRYGEEKSTPDEI
jgi:Flp pilus assembly protein TadB